MNIQTVKDQKGLYLVNDILSVPKNPLNKDYQEVQQWIANGGIVEQEDLLQEAKNKKLAELKNVRDLTNILPIDTLQGYEIINDIKSNNLVKFIFSTSPTGNTATEPNNILFSTNFGCLIDPNYYTQYSCLIIDSDGSKRKGYIAIDNTLAISLMNHYKERSINNIKVCNLIENQIEAATSLQELGEININYNENLTRFLESSTLNLI